MADIDLQTVLDAVVASIKAGIGTEVTEINNAYGDFDIAAPPTANYSTHVREVIGQFPWVMLNGSVDVENVEGGGRQGNYDIDVIFLHNYPAHGGDETLVWRYVNRMGKAISQTLKKKPTLGGTTGVITALVSEQRPDDASYSTGGFLRNVVVPLQVITYEGDSYP